MENLYVYSGKVREGDLGESTPLIDIEGKKLYVGDIVITSTIDEQGICQNHGLTVVVSDKYTSYNTGGGNVRHEVKEGKPEYFVMGIKNVDFMGKDSDRWIVKRVKSHEDVICGENWKDYGFNYSNL